MRMLPLLLLVASAACRVEAPAGESRRADAAPGETDAATPTHETATPPHTMYVADAASLPPCDAAGEGRLVYVATEGRFMACAAGAWIEVDVRGPAGPRGDAGPAGAPGAAGPAGAAAPIETGEESEHEYGWTDPATGAEWVFMGLGTWTDAGAACAGDWRMGTSAEVRDAAIHGLLLYFLKSATNGQSNNWWTSEDLGSGNANTYTYFSGNVLQSVAKSTNATIVCRRR